MLRFVLSFIVTMSCLLSCPTFSHEKAKAPAAPRVMAEEEAKAHLQRDEATVLKKQEIPAKSEENEARYQAPNIMPLEALPKATVPTSAPEPLAEKAEKSDQGDLEVLDFVLAGNVEGREPKDVVDTFASGNQRGFAFARLHAKAPAEVTFLWYRNDKLVARFKQPIQAAKKWRTYSSVTLGSGQWKVQLLAADEKVLAEKTFAIE